MDWMEEPGGVLYVTTPDGVSIAYLLCAEVRRRE
jgi:hypothetical protein